MRGCQCLEGLHDVVIAGVSVACILNALSFPCKKEGPQVSVNFYSLTCSACQVAQTSRTTRRNTHECFSPQSGTNTLAKARLTWCHTLRVQLEHFDMLPSHVFAAVVTHAGRHHCKDTRTFTLPIYAFSSQRYAPPRWNA